MIDYNKNDGNKKFYLINFKGVFETWIKHSLPVCAARTTTVSPGMLLLLNVKNLRINIQIFTTKFKNLSL